VSDEIFRHEKNLGIVLVPIGVIGLIGAFRYAVVSAQAKNGMPSSTLITLTIVFAVSLFLTALGGQVKIISSLSSGDADDTNDK
jgi:nitrate/nitrite transporter NarK